MTSPWRRRRIRQGFQFQGHCTLRPLSPPCFMFIPLHLFMPRRPVADTSSPHSSTSFQLMHSSHHIYPRTDTPRLPHAHGTYPVSSPYTYHPMWQFRFDHTLHPLSSLSVHWSHPALSPYISALALCSPSSVVERQRLQHRLRAGKGQPTPRDAFLLSRDDLDASTLPAILGSDIVYCRAEQCSPFVRQAWKRPPTTPFCSRNSNPMLQPRTASSSQIARGNEPEN